MKRKYPAVVEETVFQGRERAVQMFAGGKRPCVLGHVVLCLSGIMCYCEGQHDETRGDKDHRRLMHCAQDFEPVRDGKPGKGRLQGIRETDLHVGISSM